jgi:putative transposase
MRFALIDGAKAEFPVHRLCRVLGVSQSGYFAWRGRPACRRQRDDMVLLAHVRSAFTLSNATYGSPRMTRELQDAGLVVGRRRIARLMRDNGLQARQKRRFKRTTDSHHAWPVAPNLLDQDFTATEPDKKWAPTSPTCGPAKAGCISPSSSTCSHAGWLVGQQATGCIATWLLPLCAKP